MANGFIPLTQEHPLFRALRSARSGTLTALPGTVVGTNPNGATNLDIAISADSKFLYSLDSKIGMISVFGIQSDGTLSNLGTVGGLPQNVGFNGIAAI